MKLSSSPALRCTPQVLKFEPQNIKALYRRAKVGCGPASSLSLSFILSPQQGRLTPQPSLPSPAGAQAYWELNNLFKCEEDVEAALAVKPTGCLFVFVEGGCLWRLPARSLAQPILPTRQRPRRGHSQAKGGNRQAQPGLCREGAQAIPAHVCQQGSGRFFRFCRLQLGTTSSYIIVYEDGIQWIYLQLFPAYSYLCKRRWSLGERSPRPLDSVRRVTRHE